MKQSTWIVLSVAVLALVLLPLAASADDHAYVGSKKCKMCHLKEYKKAELVAVGMVDTVGEGQCTTCHNPDSPFVGDDFVFDFGANKGKGTHEAYPMKYEH